MMGPALARLFFELNQRKEKGLQPFENKLHEELLELAQLASRARGSLSWLQKKIPSDPSLKVTVDLAPDGWDAAAQMQTGCTYENCPNKER